MGGYHSPDVDAPPCRPLRKTPIAAPMTSASKIPLKLIALDNDDLAVISAHLQDAVVRIGDMAYLPRKKRFAAVLNRFDWLGALAAANSGRSKASERRRAGLRFERVMKARISGIDVKKASTFLELLSVTFTGTGAEDPAGKVRLDFAGGGAIELEVECIEAELKDLGAAWRARRVPNHGGEAGKKQGVRGADGD